MHTESQLRSRVCVIAVYMAVGNLVSLAACLIHWLDRLVS